MIQNVENSEIANDFYRMFLTSLIGEIFVILSDTFHKAGFRLQCELLSKIFGIVESGQVTVPLWGNQQQDQFPNNQVSATRVSRRRDGTRALCERQCVCVCEGVCEWEGVCEDACLCACVCVRVCAESSTQQHIDTSTNHIMVVCTVWSIFFRFFCSKKKLYIAAHTHACTPHTHTHTHTLCWCIDVLMCVYVCAFVYVFMCLWGVYVCMCVCVCVCVKAVRVERDGDRMCVGKLVREIITRISTKDSYCVSVKQDVLMFFVLVLWATSVYLMTYGKAQKRSRDIVSFLGGCRGVQEKKNRRNEYLVILFWKAFAKRFST